MTDPSVVYCRCNHLTSFAADFFIAPNPIDIDKVIEGFKNIKDNLSVVILISLLCGFYILLGVYLRRKDKKDSEKVTFFKVLFVVSLNVHIIDEMIRFCYICKEKWLSLKSLLPWLSGRMLTLYAVARDSIPG